MDKIAALFKEKDKELLLRAGEFARASHEGQLRKSGEPYFTHCLEVAKILTLLGMDAETVAGGFLHDVLEDTPVKEEELKKEFGVAITELVLGVSRLGELKYRGRVRYAESLRKFFLAVSRDIRVLIIKLADRLHNARTLKYLPLEKAKRIALETIEVHAKLANRLGIAKIKTELEDCAFPFAHPEEYKKIKEIIKGRPFMNEKYLEKIKQMVAKEVAGQGIKIINISYRIKRLFSLWQKLIKRGDIEKIYDFVAVRLIVPTIEDCYKALGVIHGAWKPVPSQIKDYIALPKPNGYRSLHTTIFTGDGGMTEIQIRTPEIDEEAEYGIAAHFSYKENIEIHKKEKHFGWLEELTKIQTSIKNPNSFLEHLRLDLFKNRIFVFTPEGDVVDLPEEATPVDFAYHIHSDIGDHLSGAKINGALKSLDEKLKNNDIIEIVIKKTSKPSRKWLEYAKTSLARRHIRNFLKL